MSSVRAMNEHDDLIPDHEKYLQEVGLGSRTQNLEPLLRVLQAQGLTIVLPTERALLHPLAIPLAKGPAQATQTANAALRGPEAYTCLLQYSVGSGTAGGGLPIVQMSSEALAVALLARNPDEYLHRCDIVRFRQVIPQNVNLLMAGIDTADMLIGT